jgi:glyoxylase-like metal-dependent hydrolase (beta-lactamase superfamily II)/rhodanese-related sulfurtransferase
MNQAAPSMTAAELADRVAAGEAFTALDVRPEADWPIEGPGIATVHVPAAAALADAAGLAARLEGPVAVVCARGMTAASVAGALREEGVDAAVLEQGMRGWLSTLRADPVDLGLPGMEVIQVRRPGRGCLSYVVAAAGEALVVDPAPDAAFYLDLAARLGVRITAVFDTHIHADHLSGARVLASLADARLMLPAASLERGVADPSIFTPIADGEEVFPGPPAVRAISLPGHTSDMTGLLIGERALVAGDSLFADGIARPDLQRGDDEGAMAMGRTLHGTLHDRILSLPGETVLLPCHTHPGLDAGPIAPTLQEVRDAVPELAIDDPERFAAELLADIPARPANYEAIIAVNSGARTPDPELESGGNSCAAR